MIAWHRQGFRLLWRWKNRPRGRPPVPADLRALIRSMTDANPLWGAPRIHGELLKLGIEVSQATVAKSMRTAQAPAVTVVADLPGESRDPHHGRRLLRRTNGDVPIALCIRHPRP